MTDRGWRRLFWTLGSLVLLLALAMLGVYFALPAIVRSQVKSVLANAGYEDASVDVESATPWGVKLANIRAGKDGALQVSFVRVDYAPLKVIFGKIDAVRIENANILIDLNAARSTEAKSHFDLWADANASGFPIWRIELAGCDVTLIRDQQRYTVRADGWMWRDRDESARLSLTFRAAGSPAWLEATINFLEHRFELNVGASDVDLAQLLPLLPDAVTGTIEQASGIVRTNVHLSYRGGVADTQAELELRDGRIVTSPDTAITVEGASAKLKLDDLNPLRASPGQVIDVARIGIGQDNELRNLHAEFGIDRRGGDPPEPAPSEQPISLPATVVIDALRCNWAGGELSSVGPVIVNPLEQSFAIRLKVQQVGLNDFLKLVAGGKASGDGTLSGELPLSVDWPNVAIGTGVIRSDGPGNLNFGAQVGDLAATIAQNEPRLRDQKQQLVEALTSFHYDQIVFEFTRTDQGLKVLTRVSGRGTRGTRTPLDLTVRQEGFEEAMNLYLRALLRVR